MHCQLLHIVGHCTSIKVNLKNYYVGILEFRGFKSLLLIYEKKISIGAILNWYGPKYIIGTFNYLSWSFNAALLWYWALSIMIIVFFRQLLSMEYKIHIIWLHKVRKFTHLFFLNWQYSIITFIANASNNIYWTKSPSSSHLVVLSCY